MGRDDTLGRIKSCMMLEATCSEVYHLLAMNFPAEKEALNELAMDDESRAAVIAAGMELGDPAELSGFDVPPELEHVKKAIDYARQAKTGLIGRGLALKDALTMALTLEEQKSLAYSEDFLAKESEPKVRRIFEKLFHMDRANKEIVLGLMAKYGFKR